MRSRDTHAVSSNYLSVSSANHGERHRRALIGTADWNRSDLKSIRKKRVAREILWVYREVSKPKHDKTYRHSTAPVAAQSLLHVSLTLVGVTDQLTVPLPLSKYSHVRPKTSCDHLIRPGTEQNKQRIGCEKTPEHDEHIHPKSRWKQFDAFFLHLVMGTSVQFTSPASSTSKPQANSLYNDYTLQRYRSLVVYAVDDHEEFVVLLIVTVGDW